MSLICKLVAHYPNLLPMDTLGVRYDHEYNSEYNHNYFFEALL